MPLDSSLAAQTGRRIVPIPHADEGNRAKRHMGRVRSMGTLRVFPVWRQTQMAWTVTARRDAVQKLHLTACQIESKRTHGTALACRAAR
jgi:hypothetical protein